MSKVHFILPFLFSSPLVDKFISCKIHGFIDTLYYILEGLEWGESAITFRMAGVFHYTKLLIIKKISDIKIIGLSACLEYVIFFLKIL